jgi:hypothetical protein
VLHQNQPDHGQGRYNLQQEHHSHQCLLHERNS